MMSILRMRNIVIALRLLLLLDDDDNDGDNENDEASVLLVYHLDVHY